MHLIYHNTCRICHSSSLTKVIDLGEQHLQNVFSKKGMPKPPQRKIPLSLVLCNPTKDDKACGLLQTSLTVPPQILYSTYWYRSGTNQTMRNHLREITLEVVKMVGKHKRLVLDIGSNDGTLLAFYPKNFIKVGIDPSNAVQPIKGIKVIQDIFPSAELLKEVGGKKFDAITSIAMFYDAEDAVDFVRNIKKILDKKGLWMFEVFYMPDMLQTFSYDTICHEHLSYFSLSVLEFILKKAEMKIIKVEKNKINGGSIRGYVTHIDNFSFKKFENNRYLQELRQEEFDLGLDNELPYLQFQERINKHKDELSSLLKKLKREGKKIHTYGASTKGNTLLQFCGIDNTIIDYAADRNPDKDGAYTVGTNIPIITEEKSRAMKPDYYLVLPWSFREEFLKREERALKAGIGMIFPFPQIEVVQYGV